MSNEPDKLEENDAATWLTRSQSTGMSMAAQEKFEEWRSKPANRRAYDALSDIYAQLDDIGDDEAVLKAREDALRRMRQRRSTGPWKLAIAASIATVGVTGAWFSQVAVHRPDASREQVFATRIGQYATATLADRSRLTLDADSEVAVRYEGDIRKIDLRRGRAYFEVAKDKARPFIVYAALGNVRATGTAFSVGTRSNELVVVLRQGGVRVALDKTAGHPHDLPIEMKAGTKLRADGNGWTVKPVSSDNALAWTQGFVVLDNESLADAATELNAYSDRKIIVKPEVQGRKISGTFRTGRPEEFTEALNAYGLARIESATGKAIVLGAPERKKEKNPT